MCQDDYGNVDNSSRGFESACDQHSADKVLHNKREYTLNILYAGNVAGCAAHCSGDFSFVQVVQEYLQRTQLV